jgi:hypothetical protein
VLRLEGEVCAVQTPVPKIGWRESVRVRLLHLPRLEDDLAVARAPFATRLDLRSAEIAVRLRHLPPHQSRKARPTSTPGSSRRPIPPPS